MHGVFQVRLVSVKRGKKGDIKYSTKLAIISRSTTRIVARLPNRRMTGKLLAGYGTPRSEVVLDQNFIVYGPPRITDISPKAFYKGARVNITGVDLYDIRPLRTYNHDGIAEKMIGFGSMQKLLVITDWNMQTNRIQFTVPISCGTTCQYGATPTAGHYIPHIDNPLSGHLWLTSSNSFLDTSIQCSYLPENPNNTAPLTISSAEALKWGNKQVPFVISGSVSFSGITLTGTGFKGAKAFLDNKLLGFSRSTDGKTGRVMIPYNSGSGQIVLIKGKANRRQVAKTQRFTVVPKGCNPV